MWTSNLMITTEPIFFKENKTKTTNKQNKNIGFKFDDNCWTNFPNDSLKI